MGGEAHPPPRADGGAGPGRVPTSAARTQACLDSHGPGKTHLQPWEGDVASLRPAGDELDHAKGSDTGCPVLAKPLSGFFQHLLSSLGLGGSHGSPGPRSSEQPCTSI